MKNDKLTQELIELLNKHGYRNRVAIWNGSVGRTP